MGEPLTPVLALAHLAPNLIDELTPAEIALLPYLDELWLRPEQRIPDYDWTYYGFIAGRRFGKSHGIVSELIYRAWSGEARLIGLMAPTEDRIKDVQHKPLIDASPPWFKPEVFGNGLNLRWPNGVEAHGYTAVAPGGPRGQNLDHAWLTEIVAWNPGSQLEAFNNITTACSEGRRQIFYDTTSKGTNLVINLLLRLHAEDPYHFPLVRGGMVDNPLLTRKYLESEFRKYAKGSRARDEEIFGLVYTEAAGAKYKQAWLDENRRALEQVPHLVQRLVVVDPGKSLHVDSDDTGIIVGGSDLDEDAYLLEDLSGKHPVEVWGDIAVGKCVDDGCSGVIIERDGLGDHALYTIRSRANIRHQEVRLVERGKVFPRRVPGVIWVREVNARAQGGSKISRAEGPAREKEAGRVHLVGMFPALEHQMVNYDGSGDSPNQYDAANYLITELRGLALAPVKRTSAKDLTSARTMQDILARALGQSGRVL
jgi:phage terminase large subunit-like protein